MILLAEQEGFLRSFMILVMGGVIIVVFWILTLLLLKSRRSRIKTVFACSYFLIGLGLVINLIYFFIFIEPVVLILYYIAVFCVYGANTFVMIFSLIFWKGEEIITPKKQNIIVLIFYSFLFLCIFIPNGVTINESTNWTPVWSFEFML